MYRTVVQENMESFSPSLTETPPVYHTAYYPADHNHILIQQPQILRGESRWWISHCWRTSWWEERRKHNCSHSPSDSGLQRISRIIFLSFTSLKDRMSVSSIKYPQIMTDADQKLCFFCYTSSALRYLLSLQFESQSQTTESQWFCIPFLFHWFTPQLNQSCWSSPMFPAVWHSTFSTGPSGKKHSMLAHLEQLRSLTVYRTKTELS